MIGYAVELAERPDLLGKTEEDRIKIDRFRSTYDLKDIIIAFLCNSRPTNTQEKLERKQKMDELYERKIDHEMKEHEKACQANEFYFGYLTVIDFAIYEIVNHFRLLFPQ